MESNEFKIVKKKYLAEALSFLGFNYMKFTNDENKIVYSFENTEGFNLAYSKLLQLKKEFNNIK